MYRSGNFLQMVTGALERLGSLKFRVWGPLQYFSAVVQLKKMALKYWPGLEGSTALLTE